MKLNLAFILSLLVVATPAFAVNSLVPGSKFYTNVHTVTFHQLSPQPLRLVVEICSSDQGGRQLCQSLVRKPDLLLPKAAATQSKNKKFLINGSSRFFTADEVNSRVKSTSAGMKQPTSEFRLTFYTLNNLRVPVGGMDEIIPNLQTQTNHRAGEFKKKLIQNSQLSATVSFHVRKS